jgi:hypothetical protein
MIIPVIITVYSDRSFTFVTKTPPAGVLLLKAAKIEKGSGTPNKTKVGKVTKKTNRRHREDEDARFELHDDRSGLPHDRRFREILRFNCRINFVPRSVKLKSVSKTVGAVLTAIAPRRYKNG